MGGNVLGLLSIDHTAPVLLSMESTVALLETLLRTVNSHS